MAIRSVGVVGSGQMGNGIAQVAACCGMEVTMVDIKQDLLERGSAAISNSLDKLVSKERMSRGEAESALSRVSTSVDLESLSECDLVVEAIPEIPELKFSTFSKLDSICKPQAILASNTSSISINEIASHTGRADRVIGMHFMNPVPIMKLVEIINGSETAEPVMVASVEPLACTRAPLFVAQRISAAAADPVSADRPPTDAPAAVTVRDVSAIAPQSGGLFVPRPTERPVP